MSFVEEETMTSNVVNHHIACPGVTEDYKIVVDSSRGGGYKVVANRRILKGEAIMKESLEFNFSDVRDGDYMWLGQGTTKDSKGKLANNKNNKIDPAEEPDAPPERIPVTRDMLLRTHGVHFVVNNNEKQSGASKDEAEIVLRHYLEVPTMFVNHSCDPSMKFNGVDIAARDLEVGDELTVDYAISDFDDSTFIEKCWCGAKSCRGKVLGFGTLSATDQELIFPMLSSATLAMYRAGLGQGPPVRVCKDLIPRPLSSSMLAPSGDTTSGDTTTPVMRLLWPGPSWAEAKVVVKKDEKSNQYGLFAAKDVKKGKLFYYFWRQPWPTTQGGGGGEKIPLVIDLVLSVPLSMLYEEAAAELEERGESEDDIPEGTLVARFDASKCACGSYYRSAKGELMFSGWEMLNAHSCDPNVVYRNRQGEDDDHWQPAYAAKDIKKGDRITMDWNCFIWDRRGGEERYDADMTGCACGASNCVGTKQGFKYLSSGAQTERLSMTWLRSAAVGGARLAGKAVSPYVRAMWKQTKEHISHDDDDDKSTNDASSTSCSDSSSSSSDDDNNK